MHVQQWAARLDTCLPAGLETLCSWLSARLFLTNFRPVTLTEHAVFGRHVYLKVSLLPKKANGSCSCPAGSFMCCRQHLLSLVRIAGVHDVASVCLTGNISSRKDLHSALMSGTI